MPNKPTIGKRFHQLLEKEVAFFKTLSSEQQANLVHNLLWTSTNLQIQKFATTPNEYKAAMEEVLRIGQLIKREDELS